MSVHSCLVPTKVAHVGQRRPQHTTNGLTKCTAVGVPQVDGLVSRYLAPPVLLLRCSKLTIIISFIITYYYSYYHYLFTC